MYSMYDTPGAISPTRRPIRLPKMTKYSVIVIAGGSSVWLQMRRMRVTSRRTMVPSATRVASEFMRFPCGSRGRDFVVRVDQAHEQFFQPVRLVAHRHHGDAARGQRREQGIEI